MLVSIDFTKSGEAGTGLTHWFRWACTGAAACLVFLCLALVNAARADPLLDFRMFKPPETSQRAIREPIVSWLIRPKPESFCSTAEPKDGFVARPEGCVYWQVASSQCTVVTDSPTTHSQLGHLLLHCLMGK